MKFEELCSYLDKNLDKNILFKLPCGKDIDFHFHITEIGKVHKEFIDCGGTVRVTDYCSMQIWLADDVHHRLITNKLLHILNLSNGTFNLNNLDVEVEYQKETIQNYVVKNISLDSGTLIFILSDKNTDCLAKDKCGVGNKNCCN
jgi:hypothetical protein